jgi:chemotaxis protein CheD
MSVLLLKNNFEKSVYSLYIGDYFVTRKKDVLLSTVLGPCIGVCLSDRVNGIVGMNHFMLPGRSKEVDTKFGADCTDLFINAMIAWGADRKHLRAKIFGGANMLLAAKMGMGSNVDFIEDYLKQLNIPVEEKDLGGIYGRRILFCSTTYLVKVNKFAMINTRLESVLREKASH